jgi:hypothetical protein
MNTYAKHFSLFPLHLRHYKSCRIYFDGFVKSRTDTNLVIPAKAGIQSFGIVMGSGFRQSDRF